MPKDPRKPNQMQTGAPPARLKPGDFIAVFGGSDQSWPARGVRVGIIHKVYPPSGTDIQMLDIWFGDFNGEAPAIHSVLIERISGMVTPQPFTSQDEPDHA